MDNIKKTSDVQQAKMVDNLKNVKQKLLKTNAVICFNKAAAD